MLIRDVSRFNRARHLSKYLAFFRNNILTESKFIRISLSSTIDYLKSTIELLFKECY